MSKNYVEITLAEFEDWALPRGFEPVTEEGVNEQVYIKRIGCLELRIYSSIEDGVTRGKGEDAIRLGLFSPYGNRIGSQKRTNRSGDSPDEVFARMADKIEELEKKAVTFEPLYSKLLSKRGGQMRDFASEKPRLVGTHLILHEIKDDTTSKGKPCKVISCATDFTYLGSKVFATVKTFENSDVYKSFQGHEQGTIFTIRRHMVYKFRPWKGVYYCNFGEYSYVFNLLELSAVPYSPDEAIEEVEEPAVVTEAISLDEPDSTSSANSQDEDSVDSNSADTPPPEDTEESTESVPTSELQTYGLEYPFETLNPMQSKVWRSETIQKGDNALICSATASGKTVIAEIAIAKVTSEYKVALYLAPFKALTDEKVDEWTKLFSHHKIVELTGDFRLTEKQQEELNTADIIALTTEMLDSRCIKWKEEKNQWLFQTGVVVVDETHLIASQGRGDKLEAALMKFTELNPDCQIILLSATLSDLDKLSKWIHELTGRPCTVVESNYRPSKLNIHYVPFNDESGAWDLESKYIVAKALVERHPNDKWLIFTPSRYESTELARRFQELKFDADYHNAALERVERKEVEKRFIEGDLQILTATTTLSAGVNLPARRVIVFGVHRGVNEMDAIDVMQCCGRAGRPKYDKEGDAYILLPKSEFNIQKNRLANIKIKSVLGEERDLLFHLNCEIYRGKIKNLKEAEEWWQRTFAHKLYAYIIDIKRYIRWLKKHGMISYVAEDGALSQECQECKGTGEAIRHGCFVETECAPPLCNKEKCGGCNGTKKEEVAIEVALFKTTTLGKIAAQMYHYPDDILAWANRFAGEGGGKSPDPIEESGVEEELASAWRLIHPSQIAQANYVTKSERPKIRQWQTEKLNELMKLEAVVGHLGEVEYKWLYYHYRCFSDDGKDAVVRQIRMDLERVFETLRYMGSSLQWRYSPVFWKSIELRMRYGVPADCVPLVTLKGVGHARAMKLYSAGIKTYKDIVESKQQVIQILGPNLGMSIVMQANRMIRKVPERKQLWVNV